VLPAASVFLGMALHLGTAVMVYRAARPQHTIGLLAACAYAGAPFLATEAMNGQETALACFALALFLLVYHKGPRAFLWAGFFVVAARADLILLVAVVALGVGRRTGGLPPNVVPLSKLGSGPFSAGAGTESRSSLQTARTPPVRVADSPMNCAAAACCTPCASAPPAPAFRRACRRSPD